MINLYVLQTIITLKPFRKYLNSSTIREIYIKANTKAGTVLPANRSIRTYSLSTENVPTADAKSKGLKKKVISSDFQNIRTGL